MVYEVNGQEVTVQGVDCEKVFVIGSEVLANNYSDYGKLKGYIIEVRTGNDKDTDNETDDIHVCFEIPEDVELVAELEKRFSELYREPRQIDDLALDLVIMCANELIEV